MRLPIRIFSDIHLGHRASRIRSVEMLRPLLQGAGTVIFNGDTWEELAEPWRRHSAEMLKQLRAVATEEGCEIIFLRGNHDPGFQGPAYLELADGKIIVTHGDALLRDSSPWKPEILGAKNEIQEIWDRHPNAEWCVDARFAIAREIAFKLKSLEHLNGKSLLSRCLDAAWPPSRALAILDIWINQACYAANFCEVYFPKAEVLLIGHFHHAAIEEVRGKLIVNTGSFVIPSKAYWAEWDGQYLGCGLIHFAKNGFFKKTARIHRKIISG